MKEISRGTYNIGTEEETRELGLMIADAAEAGDIVALIGDLGTGKTALTGYIAEGLGIKEKIISPTFNIIKEYRSGRLPLFHFDVYRLADGSEFFDAGAEEYLNSKGVCVIEWADIVADVLPSDALAVKLEYGGSESSRVITLF